jgi:hypothetical protein
MQLPVEFFDPLRKVTMAELVGSEEIARSKYLLGEPVGLALRAAGECPIGLNLRPASVARREELAKRRPFFVTAAVCFSFSLFGWGFYYQKSAEMIHGQRQNMEEKLRPLRRIESEFDEAKKEIASLDKMAAPLTTAINNRSLWVELIEELNARLPKENIWITDLVATSKRMPLEPLDGRGPPGERSTSLGSDRTGTEQSDPVMDGVLAHGLYLYNPRQQEVVIDYFKNLIESTWFALNPKDQANFIKPTTPTSTEWAFPYELYLELRTPVKFP